MATTGSLLSEFRDDSGALLPAEEALLKACQEGVFSDSAFERPTEMRASNRIRSAVLRVFCMGSDPSVYVHPHGVQVIGAWIDGKLDLEGVQTSQRIALIACEIDGGVVFKGMRAQAIYLQGTHLDFLEGQRLTCSDDLHLTEDFCSRGAVNLKGAEIRGDLNCNGGTFLGGNGTALDLDGINVQGGVSLGLSHPDDPHKRRAFLAKGRVSLANSTIRHDLNCQGGRISAPGQIAVRANGAKVDGCIDCTPQAGHRLVVVGEVQLQGVTVGGNLVMRDAKLRNMGGDALYADGIDVRGDLHLDKGFSCRGEVRLLGASIGGDLALDGGRFRNGDQDAIDLTNATVKGELFLYLYSVELGDQSSAVMGGSLKLYGANLSGIVDSPHAWPKLGHLRLDGCTYKRFSSKSPTDEKNRLAWLNLQPGDHLGKDFRPQPWEQCANTLSAMGHEAAANSLRVEKRKHMRQARWAHAEGGLAKVRIAPVQMFDWLLQWVLGYGFKTTRALWYIFGLWLGGALMFAALPNEIMAPTDSKLYLDESIPEECRVDWIGMSGPSSPTPNDELRRKQEATGLGLPSESPWKDICIRRVPSEYSSFQPFLYALDLILPLTDLRQERDWSPRISDAQGRTLYPFSIGSSFGLGNLVRGVEWFLILAGWAISLFVAAGVTGIAKRD